MLAWSTLLRWDTQLAWDGIVSVAEPYPDGTVVVRPRHTTTLRAATAAAIRLAARPSPAILLDVTA